MKESAKDVNQFSELEISESSQANVLAHEKAKSNPNLLSNSADENKKFHLRGNFLEKLVNSFAIALR